MKDEDGDEEGGPLKIKFKPHADSLSSMKKRVAGGKRKKGGSGKA